jgi:hypothetical protein
MLRVSYSQPGLATPRVPAATYCVPVVCVVVLLINLMPPRAIDLCTPTHVARAVQPAAERLLALERALAEEWPPLPTIESSLFADFRALFCLASTDPIQLLLRLFCPSWGPSSRITTRMPLHLA